jgi:hypothetical protein
LGFYGLGQIIGKSMIVEKYWTPKKKIKKGLITLGPKLFHPVQKPDPATEEVFRQFDVKVFVPL